MNNDPNLKAALDSIMNDLRDGKEYGSILTVAPVDFAALYARMDEVQNDISLHRESALNTYPAADPRGGGAGTTVRCGGDESAVYGKQQYGRTIEQLS